MTPRDNNDVAPPPRRPARRLRRAVYLLLILVLALSTWVWWTYLKMTDPERLRQIARTYLQLYANGPVSINSADFSWRGGLTLKHVAIADQRDQRTASTNDAKPPPKLFDCDEVQVKFRGASLLRGAAAIESVTVIEPRCLIVHREADEATDFAGFAFQSLPINLSTTSDQPIVEVRKARFDVVRRSDGGDRLLESLGVDLRAVPVRGREGYEVTWRGDDGSASGHLHVNLRSGEARNISGGLPPLSLRAIMIAVHAKHEAALAWSDLLQLSGRLRVRDFHFQVGPNTRPTFALIDLRDVALSIPVSREEYDLRSQERYLNFAGVDGSIHIGNQMAELSFQGRFHDAACRVSATLSGDPVATSSVTDVGFDAMIECTGLNLPSPAPKGPPDQARFIDSWPSLTRFYRDFDPSARADVTLRFGKSADRGSTVRLMGGRLRFHDGRAVCRYFSYEVHELRGEMEFKPGGIYVNHVCGVRMGGELCVDGWMSEATGCGAGWLEVSGRGIPIDGALYDAAPAGFRRVHDRFCPEGELDARVILARRGCVDGVRQEWQSHSDIRFDNLSANYADFPYPLTHASGEVGYAHGELRVHDLTADAGDGAVRLTGHAAFGGDGDGAIDLHVEATQIGLDDQLANALPGRFSTALRRLQARGSFDADVQITSDRRSLAPPDFRALLQLHDVALQPPYLAAEIDAVSGEVELTRAGVALSELTGRLHNGAVSAGGFIPFGENPSDSLFLSVHAPELVLDDVLVASLPAEVGARIDGWRIPHGCSARINLSGGESPDTGRNTRISGMLTLNAASVEHPRLSAPLTAADGWIAFDSTGAGGELFRARCAEAEVRAAFGVDAGERRRTTLALTAHGLAFNELVRLRSTDAGLSQQASGVVDLYLDELTHVPTSEGSTGEWSMRGRADLRRVSHAGLPSVVVNVGTVTFDGGVGDSAGNRLAGNFQLDSATIQEHPLHSLRGDWTWTGAPSAERRLELSSIEGTLYDGALSANLATTTTSAATEYQLALVARGLNIRPLTAAFKEPPTSAGRTPPLDVSGFADVQLAMSGAIGDANSRRGQGRVDVKNGQLYRLPLLAAILQVMNLTIPAEDTLDEAAADFLVEGNRITFNDIELRGRTLNLIGSGSMSLPDQGLNLHLVNVNPTLAGRIPIVSEIAHEISKELVELHVTGPLYRPRVRTTPFRGLSDELKALFQKRKPRKVEPTE